MVAKNQHPITMANNNIAQQSSVQQSLPQELKQFVADFKRNCERYPLEFSPIELTTKPSATARKDPMNGSWLAAVEKLERKLK